MGEYDTPFCIMMRFFWPSIQTDIKYWVLSVYIIAHTIFSVPGKVNYIYHGLSLRHSIVCMLIFGCQG